MGRMHKPDVRFRALDIDPTCRAPAVSNVPDPRRV